MFATIEPSAAGRSHVAVDGRLLGGGIDGRPLGGVALAGGFVVGAAVGATVGATVGAAVGAAVGSAVGASVGSAVAVAVAVAVGFGLPDGLAPVSITGRVRITLVCPSRSLSAS